ncbi:hypothetical protein TSAR_001964 [Trichomalopsis sarcophagae]|uniref:Uncharacterized protein n=1 Tax=Trichomalopsis sarcophagae TaxID=543379 RepID=A0A232EHH9_9HYME|nr:hypothetical protein TSAR_001964 [Trichomalopsis sarcophagae]
MSRINLNNPNYYDPPPSYEDICGRSVAPKNNRIGEHEKITRSRGDTATPIYGVTECSVRPIGDGTEDFSRTIPLPEIEQHHNQQTAHLSHTPSNQRFVIIFLTLAILLMTFTVIVMCHLRTRDNNR